MADDPSDRMPQPIARTLVQDTTIPPQARALLATIGGPGFESDGSYTQRFNQPDFADFSKHPGTFGKIDRGPNKGLNSNAAGRYQLISTTFADQAKKQGLTDFSPQSQDKAAWGLAQEAYRGKYPGRDLAADLQNPGNLPRVAQALRSTWTSLPGGIEQGGALAQFASSYMSNLKTEVARGQGAPAPAIAPAGQPPASQVADGQPKPMILTANPLASFASLGSR